ncbi:hypothetical protein [Portibacter marinus]|uniref:hypothetical protein n=1 Tax=Portibacter marinus TaxID=2898660 RepID=UPI001F45C8BF|nr:hypothetical protein [Portibacter marinus]
MKSKGFYRSISIIHTSLFIGQLMLFAILLYLKQDFELKTDFQEDIFLLILPALILSVYFLGNYIYQSRIKSIIPSESLDQKLITYRSAVIIRLALIEGVTLLALMIYFINGNSMYLIMALILLVYFYSLKPGKDKLNDKAQLSAQERQQI